jgi:hypothetical protein
MAILLLYFLAFSQTVTTSPLISDFESQWSRYSRNGTITEINARAWSASIQSRAQYKTPEEKAKADEYARYSVAQLMKKISALEAKGGNEAAIKELTKIHAHLQEARVQYTLDPTSTDLYLAIERYQKMYTHLEAKVETYLGSFSSRMFAMDVEKAKRELVGDTWDYNVRHTRYVTQDSGSTFVMPSDSDLMEYNKAYCDCVFVHNKRSVVERRRCAAETVDVNRACDVFSNPGDQPLPRRLQECGSGKVYIFPYATGYFVNNSCTLDLGRAKSFLQSNIPRSGGGAAGIR